MRVRRAGRTVAANVRQALSSRPLGMEALGLAKPACWYTTCIHRHHSDTSMRTVAGESAGDPSYVGCQR